MKKFKFFTMALAAMSMVACSNEDEMGRNNPGVGTKGTGIEVQFDVDGTAAGKRPVNSAAREGEDTDELA